MHSSTAVTIDFSPLRKAMAERHVSRKALAAEIGVAYTTIWRWEHGSTPSLKELVAVARALGWPMLDLFTVKDRP